MRSSWYRVSRRATHEGAPARIKIVIADSALTAGERRRNDTLGGHMIKVGTRARAASAQLVRQQSRAGDGAGATRFSSYEENAALIGHLSARRRRRIKRPTYQSVYAAWLHHTHAQNRRRFSIIAGLNRRQSTHRPMAAQCFTPLVNDPHRRVAAR